MRETPQNGNFACGRETARGTIYAICKLTRASSRPRIREYQGIPKCVFCINFTGTDCILNSRLHFPLAGRVGARALSHSVPLPYLRSFQRIRFACAHFFCMQPTSSSKRPGLRWRTLFLSRCAMLFNEPSYVSETSGPVIGNDNIKHSAPNIRSHRTNILNKSINLLAANIYTFQGKEIESFQTACVAQLG